MYRSISILATVLAQVAIGVRRDIDFIDLPAGHFVAQPSPFQSQHRFVKRTVTCLAAHGEAFWKIIWSGQDVVSIEALDPTRCRIEYNRDYTIKMVVYTRRDGTQETLVPSRYKHLRLMELPGEDHGLGPIQACRASIAGAVDLRDYASGWFDKNTMPSGVLTSDQTLTPEQSTEAKKSWRKLQAGGPDVAVFGRGVKYQPVLIKPADAQFLESQEFSTADIARMFGIPAAYLLAKVDGSNLTYQNLEQIDTQFLRTTLMQYAAEIEDALTDLLPHGEVAQFKFSQLLRPDSRGRIALYLALAKLGILTAADHAHIRAAEGLPAADAAAIAAASRVAAGEKEAVEVPA